MWSNFSSRQRMAVIVFGAAWAASVAYVVVSSVL
jgi:hypothetical protein